MGAVICTMTKYLFRPKVGRLVAEKDMGSLLPTVTTHQRPTTAPASALTERPHKTKTTLKGVSRRQTVTQCFIKCKPAPWNLSILFHGGVPSKLAWLDKEQADQPIKVRPSLRSLMFSLQMKRSSPCGNAFRPR